MPGYILQLQEQVQPQVVEVQGDTKFPVLPATGGLEIADLSPPSEVENIHPNVPPIQIETDNKAEMMTLINQTLQYCGEAESKIDIAKKNLKSLLERLQL